MENNVLELKVAELEKRIIFLYKMLEKQSAINQKCIDNLELCRDILSNYISATNDNTMAIAILVENFSKEEED